MLSRHKNETLRALSDAERELLEQISRSGSEPAGQVAHAKGLLAVAAGKTYTEAAVIAGRQTGDTVAHWVSEFNRRGLAALASKTRGWASPQVWGRGMCTHPEGGPAAAHA